MLQMSSSLGIRVHDVGPRFARRGLWLGDQCCRLRASGYGELPKIQGLGKRTRTTGAS